MSCKKFSHFQFSAVFAIWCAPRRTQINFVLGSPETPSRVRCTLGGANGLFARMIKRSL